MQLYERKVLKNTKQKKKFQQNDDYKYIMTEESESEGDDDVIRTHRLQWRSDSKILGSVFITLKFTDILLHLVELNEFMQVLDTRIKEDSRTPGGFSLKSRVESQAPSTSPPADAPSWSI
jgi:hypothetical protein